MKKYSYKVPHSRTSCTPHEVSAFIYILIDVGKKKKKAKRDSEWRLRFDEKRLDF